ncbi:MAG: hypothetical protein ACOCTT_03720 [archaeon]
MGEITKKLYNQAKGKHKVKAPFLKLAERQGDNGPVKGTGPKKLKLLKEKIVEGQEYRTNKERKEVEYIFELLDGENKGEHRRYRKKIHTDDGYLHYLHESMKDFKKGDTLIMEYKKKENDYGGYIDVRPVNIDEDQEDDLEAEEEKTPEDPDDIDPDDIPVVNAEDEEDEPSFNHPTN